MQLSNGLRSHNGQRKCCKDMLKAGLEKMDADGKRWQDHRHQWHHKLTHAAARFEVKQRRQSEGGKRRGMAACSAPRKDLHCLRMGLRLKDWILQG